MAQGSWLPQSWSVAALLDVSCDSPIADGTGQTRGARALRRPSNGALACSSCLSVMWRPLRSGGSTLGLGRTGLVSDGAAGNGASRSVSITSRKVFLAVTSCLKSLSVPAGHCVVFRAGRTPLACCSAGCSRQRTMFGYRAVSQHRFPLAFACVQSAPSSNWRIALCSRVHRTGLARPAERVCCRKTVGSAADAARGKPERAFQFSFLTSSPNSCSKADRAQCF